MTQHPKIISIEFSELDITILLEALGAKQIAHWDARQPSKAVDILIERIYRALGVRMDRENGKRKTRQIS